MQIPQIEAYGMGHNPAYEAEPVESEWANKCAKWVRTDFENCLFEMMAVLGRFQASCPEGNVMTQADEIHVEACLHDLITDTLAAEFKDCKRVLEDAGYETEIFTSRFQQSKRPVFTNPATIPQMKEVEARYAKEFGGEAI